MPRPTRAQGRPSTAVIPAGWSAGHRPVIAKTLTGTCEIRRPGGVAGAFDPDLGYAPVTPHAPHHAGPCRVQVLPALEQERVTGGQDVTLVGYQVTVEWDATVEPPDDTSLVDQLVKVTAVDGNGDPSLVGRELTVRSVMRGSLAWERDLICTDNLA